MNIKVFFHIVLYGIYEMNIHLGLGFLRYIHVHKMAAESKAFLAMLCKSIFKSRAYWFPLLKKYFSPLGEKTHELKPKGVTLS